MELVELVKMKSISHRKESSERHNKTGKRKPSTEAISSEESMVIDVNLTSHEDLKSSNF
jgi:hypothetical protein